MPNNYRNVILDLNDRRDFRNFRSRIISSLREGKLFLNKQPLFGILSNIQSFVADFWLVLICGFHWAVCVSSFLIKEN